MLKLQFNPFSFPFPFLLTQMNSLDSVKMFAGVDYEQAYIPDNAKRVLSRYDKTAQHFTLKEELILKKKQLPTMAISNCFFSPTSENPRGFSVWCVLAKFNAKPRNYS